MLRIKKPRVKSKKLNQQSKKYFLIFYKVHGQNIYDQTVSAV